MWRCPACGHRFVSRKLWHSCGRYPLDAHFEDGDPVVRETFDRLVALTRALGPVTVYAQKTRIVFQVLVRFAGAVPRRHWLNVHLWLPRRADHDRLTRVEAFGRESFGLHFRFTHPDQLDAPFRALLCEAYATGRREHLRARR